jgi:hypothetical protein
MGSGKILCVIAGIITIFATYILSWVSVTVPPTFYAYGIGFIKNLPAMFTEADALGLLLGVPGFVIYIVAGIGIVFLLSGIFQLIGMKSRTFVLIGSIFVLLMGIMILLGTLNIVINIDWVIYIFGDSAPIIEGRVPFDLALGPASLGLYVLIAGGVLGLIAGIMGPD